MEENSHLSTGGFPISYNCWGGGGYNAHLSEEINMIGRNVTAIDFINILNTLDTILYSMYCILINKQKNNKSGLTQSFDPNETIKFPVICAGRVSKLFH